MPASSGHDTTVVIVKVGSRGFLNMAGITQLYKLVKADPAASKALETEVIRHAVIESYQIWCKQNWKGED